MWIFGQHLNFKIARASLLKHFATTSPGPSHNCPRRFYKIYTKKGDGGTSVTPVTGLQNRIPKSSAIFAVLGDFDELSCHLGMAREHQNGLEVRSQGPEERNEERFDVEERTQIKEDLQIIQQKLQDCNTEVAQGPSQPHSLNRIASHDIEWLEKRIDVLTAQLPPLKSFILPSGGLAAASLHISRAVCRRTERSLTEYVKEHFLRSTQEKQRDHDLVLVQGFVNRLSDYLFTAARHSAKVEGKAELAYSSKKQ